MGQEFDLVIRGGTIVDGSGGEPFAADVAVSRGSDATIFFLPWRAHKQRLRSSMAYPAHVIDLPQWSLGPVRRVPSPHG